MTDGSLVTFFLVTTTPVKAATTVTISASLGGVTQEAVLQVLPPGM
jgi:hypothetical protein